MGGGAGQENEEGPAEEAERKSCELPESPERVASHSHGETKVFPGGGTEHLC